jgi:hypothetical protein
MMLAIRYRRMTEIPQVTTGSCTEMLEIIIGVTIIVFCLGASSAFIFYSRRQIDRIARMRRSTYRDIMQDRHG